MRIRRGGFYFLSILFLSASLINGVNAGSFKVFPLKLTLDENTKTTLFKITNTGDTAVTVQLETARWFQNKKGEDKYQPTKDIVFFPKIVKIDPSNQRIIRIGYRGKKTASLEKTYRIFAQELPDLSEAKSALKFSLRFSVPIFITSARATSAAKIDHALLTNGGLNVFVKNNGSQHFVVKSIHATGHYSGGEQAFSAKTGGWYVLPNANKGFVVNVPENECRLSEKISLEVITNIGSYQDSVSVDSGDCVKIDEIVNKSNALSFAQ